MITPGTQLSKDYAKQITKNKLKERCVTQIGNKYYYPPTIPKERSNSTKKLSIAICIVLSAGVCLLTSLKFTTFLVYLCIGFIGNFFIHLLYRLILICEEFQHVKTRYGNSYSQIWIDAFRFPKKAVGALIVAIFCISFLMDDWNFDVTFNTSLFFILTIIFLLGKFFDLESSPLHSSLQISQINGLDYGSGMAYSFYNGYLKLILTENGNTDKSLKQLMEIYEGQHSVQFEVYKLFILIPISLRCFVSLKNEFSPSVDESNVKIFKGHRKRGRSMNRHYGTSICFYSPHSQKPVEKAYPQMNWKKFWNTKRQQPQGYVPSGYQSLAPEGSTDEDDAVLTSLK